VESDQIRALSCGNVEPELGFEPRTFRLRDESFASDWTAMVGSSLLTWGAASIWSDPEGGSRIVWMIKRMIKAHSIPDRMAGAPGQPISTPAERIASATARPSTPIRKLAAQITPRPTPGRKLSSGRMMAGQPTRVRRRP
jgi:hypothetical protein